MTQSELWTPDTDSHQQTLGSYMDTQDYSGSQLLLIGGTSDPEANDLRENTGFLVGKFAKEDVRVAGYAATIRPLIGGKEALSYNESREQAEREIEWNLVHEMGGRAVVAAYSQGADAAQRAVDRLVRDGVLDPDNIQLLLFGFPRHPGGLKDAMSRRHHITSALFHHAFDATMDGAWEPNPDIRTTLISMQHDPITSMPHIYPNIPKGLTQFGAGFFGVHSGQLQKSFSSMGDLEIANMQADPDMSNITYMELATDDPMKQYVDKFRVVRDAKRHQLTGKMARRMLRY